MTWLAFALLTVVSWGVYGIFLHTGQMGMQDPANGRYKAFLFVGIAYFLVAVLAPLLLLILSGANWKYPIPGMAWSLIAGIVGAIGAFGVLLAFGAKGQPAVVMADRLCRCADRECVRLAHSASASGRLERDVRWQFWCGIVLAAIGGALVTKFKPTPAPPAKKAPITASCGIVHAAPGGDEALSADAEFPRRRRTPAREAAALLAQIVPGNRFTRRGSPRLA